MATKTRKYRKESCHTNKTAAKAKAKSMRNAGNTASVRKVGKGFCVFTAGKAKTPRRRK